MHMKKGFQYVKAKVKELTTEPGCYIMKDRDGKIFYIGKAKNLRSRLKNYFAKTDSRLFVQLLEHMLWDLEIIEVRNDTEALLLERDLISKHKPRFNIMLKDDKNYILLKLKRIKKNSSKLRDLFPKLEIVRKAKKDQARYFGPYPSASRLRTTIELINKYFLLRTCPDNVLENRVRPCIQYQIGRCLAPCVFDGQSYGQELENVAYFLSGQTKDLIKNLKNKMWTLADSNNFEGAAKIRDQIQAIETSMASQVIKEVNQRKKQDIIGFSRHNEKISIVQIILRDGAWQHSINHFFDNQPFADEEVLISFLESFYGQAQDLPQEIILPAPVAKGELSALMELFKQKSAHQTKLIHPQKGRKIKLLEIANKNAHSLLKENISSKETSDASLLALQNFMGLSQKPMEIECIDISLIQGTDPYGSLVHFSHGRANKKAYKIYKIKTVLGMNDFAMIKEVVSRRLKHGIKNNDLPDLLLIDGGKGQLNAALEACAEADIIVSPEGFMVAGIAKARTLANESENISRSDERLFLPGQKEAISLPLNSKERHLVENIRDEAHRFALKHHRSQRSKRHLKSSLLEIPGVGKKRALTLLKEFGSVALIKNASAQEIAKAIKVSEADAQKILDHLKNN